MGDAHQLPFFRDMIRGAMNSGDEGIIVLSNNDVRIDPALADEIKKQCREKGCYWAFRVENPGGSPDGGIDLIAMTRQFWVLHQRQFPDYLFASVWWDNSARRVFLWAGCQEGKRLYYHSKHAGWIARKDSPGIIYNTNKAREWLKEFHENE